MKIEHTAMYVSDLEREKEFFVTYFGAKANQRYESQHDGFMSYFLTFDDASRLELMYKPIMKDIPKEHLRNGFHHIAMSVGSREKVDEITERLRADGYEVVSNPRTTGDGYYESCIIAFEDNQIEITI